MDNKPLNFCYICILKPGGGDHTEAEPPTMAETNPITFLERSLQGLVLIVHIPRNILQIMQLLLQIFKTLLW